jgi:hypothetical protein
MPSYFPGGSYAPGYFPGAYYPGLSLGLGESGGQGFATFDPKPAILDMPMVPLLVYRLTTDQLNQGGKYQPLPNIIPLRIETRVGAAPGRAVFKYILDPDGPLGDPAWPSTPEDVITPGKSGPYLVAQDDRIVVFGVTGRGDLRILFDGFAQTSRAILDPSHCMVEFQAQATPVRLADKPVWGRIDRNPNDPDTTSPNILTTLPIVFNPDGQPNATDEDKDGDIPGSLYPDLMTPMFLDTLTCQVRQIGRKWSLAMAIHYLLAVYNDQIWIKNGDLTIIDTLLDGRRPMMDDNGDWDVDNPATYTEAPIIIREFEATGMTWPKAVEELLKQYGFQMFYRLSMDANKRPVWLIRVYRVMNDDVTSYKQVRLQAYGSDLDLARTNTVSLGLERDTESVENEVVIYGKPDLIEGSFVLAPHFTISPADAAPANLKKYDLTDQNPLVEAADDDRDLDDYRTYVFDETGEGHWDWASGDYVEGPDQATSLAQILSSKGNDETVYLKRRRPGRRNLLTTDINDEPRPSALVLSFDYSGPVPAIWDGTGHWHQVGNAWKMLDDRLGIRLTCKNPEAWQTGNEDLNFGINLKTSRGLIKGVSAQALPTETHFHLMLTTVIESDQALQIIAPKRQASPGKFAVQRYVDAADRYRTEKVAANSWWNFAVGGNADIIYTRDDDDDATADAAQKRALAEMPSIAGPITLFGLVNTYSLVDRITSIAGRNLSLITNLDLPDEGPAYPVVVGIDYDLDGRQLTTLHLHDQRARGEYT